MSPSLVALLQHWCPPDGFLLCFCGALESPAAECIGFKGRAAHLSQQLGQLVEYPILYLQTLMRGSLQNSLHASSEVWLSHFCSFFRITEDSCPSKKTKTRLQFFLWFIKPGWLIIQGCPPISRAELFLPLLFFFFFNVKLEQYLKLWSKVSTIPGRYSW